MYIYGSPIAAAAARCEEIYDDLLTISFFLPHLHPIIAYFSWEFYFFKKGGDLTDFTIKPLNYSLIESFAMTIKSFINQREKSSDCYLCSTYNRTLISVIIPWFLLRTSIVYVWIENPPNGAKKHRKIDKLNERQKGKTFAWVNLWLIVS